MEEHSRKNETDLRFCQFILSSGEGDLSFTQAPRTQGGHESRNSECVEDGCWRDSKRWGVVCQLGNAQRCGMGWKSFVPPVLFGRLLTAERFCVLQRLKAGLQGVRHD